jgi:hypothetical protein
VKLQLSFEREAVFCIGCWLHGYKLTAIITNG